MLGLLVSTGHTSSIRKVDGLHGIKGKYTLLSSSVTTAKVAFSDLSGIVWTGP